MKRNAEIGLFTKPSQLNHAMSTIDTCRILLVQPPVAGPSTPPWMLAQVGSYLDDPGLFLETVDANLDFFLNHLLAPGRLNRFVSLIKKREKQGVFETAGPSITSLLADLAANPEKWARKIAAVGSDLELFRTEDFFQPERCLASLKNIDAMLSLASLAYYPSRLEWNRFFTPAVKDWAQAIDFINDMDANPFLPLCRDMLTSRLEHPELKLLILCVSVPDQVLAALTIALFSKKQRPDLHVALMGDNDLLTGAEAYDITLLPETDPEPLLNLVSRLSQSVSSGYSAVPDFSGLPLKEYLSAALVLPLRGRPADVSSDLMPPPIFWADLATYQQVVNAEGFLSIDTRLKPAYMVNQTIETTPRAPSLCLALLCSLDESAGLEAMAVAHQLGVKFIQWRHPSGRLKSLTKLLWDASKAGIWNHVIMPAAPESDLDRELVNFMAANPNIVHSWVRCQSSNAPFSSYAEQPEASETYTHVSKLPGSPLWHFLNDPVHMLLYLNRYGAKKLLHWRVRDDGSSVYSLGRTVDYYYVKPKELPPGYLDEICRMVEAGGSVDITLVKYNLERAFLIGYALEDGVIVGNSTLKHPRAEYVDAVNQQSGLDLSNYLERGYTSVRPEYRGMAIGANLLEGLTKRVGNMKVFSIISEDNIAAQKMALRNQTQQVATFYSKKLGKKVGIWIPAWMLDD